MAAALAGTGEIREFSGGPGLVAAALAESILSRTAFRLAVDRAGRRRPAMRAMTAMTTMSSINVKAVSVGVVFVVSME
jgi:hypothetical protein